MNVTQAGKALGIHERTLKLWAARPELSPYFSARAKQEGIGRDFNDDDIIVANTIRSLRAGAGNSNVNWQSIADQLGGNYRDRTLPPSAQLQPTGLSVVDEQSRLATITEQRDSALTRNNELRVENERLRSEIDDLHEARRQDAERIGRSEVELELWRTGRLRPLSGE